MRPTSVPVRRPRPTASHRLSGAVAEALEPRRLLANATVTGAVFWDADGSGKKAAMEAEVGGHNVYVDLNNNGALDANEPSTGVRAFGSFYLEYTDPGYTVSLRRIIPAGWEATTPAAAPLSGTGAHSNIYFGSRRLNAPGSITVGVFDDANGNGVRDAGEGPLANADVYLDLTNPNRFRDPTDPGATTNSDGVATIQNLPAGEYSLRILPGRNPTNGTDATVQTAPAYDTSIPVTVGTGNTNLGVRFGLAPASLFGRVSGFVYHDKNGNGTIDIGTDFALLSNRTVYADLNENGALDDNEPQFTTQVDGYWMYLRPGTYTLRQVVARDWRQTVPADPSAGLRITVDQYGTRDGTNFATATDSKPTAIPGGPYTVNEGTPLTLTAGPSPTNQGPFTYAWDFFYDGQTFRPSAAGASVVFPSDIINGPATQTVALRVTDGDGIASDVVTTTVTVNNVAPTATFAAAPSTVQAGQSTRLVFSNPKDPDESDVAAGFRYSYDLDGDHVYDIVGTPNSAVAVPADYLKAVGTKQLWGRITDKDGGSTEYATTIQVTPVVDNTQAPYSGVALPLAATGTTTVQVENYDNGKEGIAYHDTEAANLGGSTYRGTTGVDLENITDGGAGVGVGYVKAGEWLEYALVVMSRGTYNVGFRVASLRSGGSLHLEVDGAKVGNSISVPDTGAWTTWRTITLNNVQLPEGTHTFRLAFDTNGSIGYVGNFNFMTFTKTTVTPPPPPPPTYTGTPFKGTPAKVNASGSSTIELENFDDGGEGVAYHDTDSANLGKTTYRTGGVDVEAINDGGAGYGLGYAKASEWLKYTVDVAADGTYDLDVRLASLTGGGAFHLEVDGVRLASNIAVPKTGAWTTYATVRQSLVSLKAGRHVVRLVMDANGSTGYVANFNWMRFTRH